MPPGGSLRANNNSNNNLFTNVAQVLVLLKLAKLLMQLASYLCQPLFQIFLDLSKAYDNLDHRWIMLLLEAYGVGAHTRSIIDALWEHKLMVPKSGDCFGNPFHPTRGVRQGDIISPIVFNIAVDTVLCE
jgi:hypothetical protein